MKNLLFTKAFYVRAFLIPVLRKRGLKWFAIINLLNISATTNLAALYVTNCVTVCNEQVFIPLITAQLQHLANQPNGQTRMENEQRLQRQKHTQQMELTQRGQELMTLRAVSRFGFVPQSATSRGFPN